MFFFNKKLKLVDTDVFHAAIDWHSHILPGVDDGIPNMADALAVLHYYEQIGISEVWLTPHIMEDIPNTTDELRDRFDELTYAYNGPILLHLAAENMLDNLFDERLKAGDVLPIGPGGKCLLVETSYFQPPLNLRKTLKHIREVGYQPILAHPERYIYMNDDDYDYLAKNNVMLQLNIISLTGAYGESAQAKAKHILGKGYYSFWGSDLHRLAHFSKAAEYPSIRKDDAKRLLELPNRIL